MRAKTKCIDKSYLIACVWLALLMAPFLVQPAHAATTTATSSGNIIANPGFESGTAPWIFYTGGTGTFTTAPTNDLGNNAAKISIGTASTSVQLYQYNIPLEPNTRYRLTFSAYSTTGHDFTIYLHKHATPYTSYGLYSYTVNLSTSWQTFTTEFTTSGFTTAVNDARLRFWMAPYAAAGDVYYIDDVKLEKIGSAATATPVSTPTGTAIAAAGSFKRAMYVNDYGTTFKNATTVDSFVNDAAYMNVDAIFILLRYGYIEAARDPVNKGGWDSRTKNTYNGMPLLEYIIQQAHAKGIQVHAWFPVNIVVSASDDEYRLFGPSAATPYTYNPWSSCSGGKYGFNKTSYRMDMAFTGLQDYEAGKVGWVAGHYPTLDGIHIEEPYLDQYSYSPPVQSGVQAKFGYNICSPPSAKTIAQVKQDITSVQRDNWNSLFAKMRAAVNNNKANPKLQFSANEWFYWYSTTNTWGLDPMYISNNHLIDWYLYQNGINITSLYINNVKSLNSSISIPFVSTAYVINAYAVLNPNLFDEIKNTCSSGSDAEGIFTYQTIISRTINGQSIKEWLHANPPSPSCAGVGIPDSTAVVSIPTFSPAAGTYATAQSVALSTSTTGATIRYTLDGTEPTSASAVYNSPISVSSTKTIKAKAFKTGMADSATASATYTINDVPGTTGNPVAYWSFDENTGTVAFDKSVYDNVGTIYGAMWTAGKSGSALAFDPGSYVDAGNKSVLDITGPITIAAWIKPNLAQEACASAAANGNSGVAAKAMSGSWSWQMRFGAPNNCYLGFQFNGIEGSRWVTVGQNLTPGNWYYVAAVFNGTAVKSYLNGAEKETAFMTGIKPSSAKVLIGQEGWGNYFTGTIDEVKIWNRALSASEIQAEYVAGIDNPPKVSIAAPLNHTTVLDLVKVSANATDDYGVTKVEFYVDNVLAAEDASQPYTYVWNTTAYGNGHHVIKAVAYDTGKNSASAEKSVFVNNPVVPAVQNPTLKWTSGGDAPWVWQSGNISDYENTWIKTTATGAGTLKFSWRVSSEPNYDYIAFYIDGVLQEAISGENGWYAKTYAVGSGTHTFLWMYYKDRSVIRGGDAGWLKDVEFTNTGSGNKLTGMFTSTFKRLLSRPQN